MSVRARIIGLGQAVAGDDGVGLVVLEHLSRLGVPPVVEVLSADDATHLIEQVICPWPVVIVDAMLSDSTRPGTISEVRSEDLDERASQPLSTHGMSVKQALELARTLYPDGISPDIRIIGIAIQRPTAYDDRLSEEVSSAVPRVAELILERVKTENIRAGS